ncbi:phage holin family protein [Azoarcus sp. L1K30]|uniref:phage holin family protein n=1 Tax=Azoarcus sp. L1K30 TaxID=2820277 RepID=UPI001B815849|nr:phage holin family protein [Azoarcus sp. L1K30]
MGERRRPRLADGLRGFLGQALETAQTRVELLAVEVQEEKLRLTGLLFNILLCALLLAFGIVFLLIFLTVLLWEEHRLLALGIATGVCLLAALLTATNAARELRRGSRLFAASLAELARDRAALRREE